jgi:hypothetical protein
MMMKVVLGALGFLLVIGFSLLMSLPMIALFMVIKNGLVEIFRIIYHRTQFQFARIVYPLYDKELFFDEDRLPYLAREFFFETSNDYRLKRMLDIRSALFGFDPAVAHLSMESALNEKVPVDIACFRCAVMTLFLLNHRKGSHQNSTVQEFLSLLPQPMRSFPSSVYENLRGQIRTEHDLRDFLLLKRKITLYFSDARSMAGLRKVS